MERWWRRRVAVILYLGLICWVWLSGMTQAAIDNWGYYAFHVLLTALLVAPALFFAWHRELWKASWPANRFWRWWLCCFVVYLPGLLLVLTYWDTRFISQRDRVIVCVIGIILLEGVLVLNAFGRQGLRQWKWIQRISFEKALLISIVLISITLGIMAVSSIGNPVYDQPERLLVGFEFDLTLVFSRFGTFLSFTLQFIFMYACGYFYYLLNNRLLVPRVLKQQGWVMYCLVGLAVVAITYPLVAQLLTWLPINKRLGVVFETSPFGLQNGFAAVLILLLSLPVVVALQWVRQNNTILALEKAKAQTELDLLQQQLNPHFFFNTLNNLYALSLAQAKETPETILQLSELMRYVIYQAKEPLVNTEAEIRYLGDYLQLQRMRFKRQPDIRFTYQVAPDAPLIPPLLLIVLVENACKHGIERATGPAFLHMDLVADREKLSFSCVNSFEAQEGGAGGIGLNNLQRRLSLLFPGKHRFSTYQENHTFKATLVLMHV